MSAPIGPEPGDHGGDGAALAVVLGIDPSDVLDLSASLNPVAPDPVPVLARRLGALRRYPDHLPAEAALAAAIGVDPALLVLTGGGAAAIALVAAEHPIGWVDEPDFSLYRRHLAEVRPDAPRWQSDPHNPTGLLAHPSERVFVRDEAFYPLATGEWTRGDPATIVVGSLTKLLACPGLRVGYVIARNPAEAERIRARRPGWPVNGLVAEGLADLLHAVDLPRWRDEVAALRHELVAVLDRHGLAVRPSDACWVLVDRAAHLRSPLAAEAVLVRDCTSFGLAGTVRVAVPDRAGIARLDRALGAVLSPRRPPPRGSRSAGR